MKRFYCTICRKMKRTQKWPVRVQNVDSIDPTLRVGECNHHSSVRVIRTTRVERIQSIRKTGTR